MKAARLVGPQRFEFLEVETPAPKPGEVLVRFEHVSICGSDLRSYDRSLPEEDYPLPVGRPCHELLGVVEESLEPGFKRGQRVIAVTNQGGLLEYGAVATSDLVAIPENVDDPAPWVLCQPVGTVLYAVQQMGSVLGRRVAIIGQGPIGLAFTDFIARAGARQVIVSDLLDYRLDMAKRLGATHTVNAAREEMSERVAAITGGAMADFVVEVTGRPEAYQQVFASLRRQGTAILFGMTHTEDVFPFDMASAYAKIPHIIVTNSAMAGDRVECVRMCVDLVAQGRLSVDHLLTHRMPFSDIPRAYDMYSAKKDESLKIVINV